MDETAWQMVLIIRDSGDETRIVDAINALFSFAPNLDEKSMQEVIWQMTLIIRDSGNEYRRAAAQKVLAMFKNLELMRRRRL